LNKEQTKRKLKLWMVVTGGVLALIVCGLLLLQSPLVLNRVEQGIKNAVESRLKVRFHVGKLSGNPLAGLTLHDVRFVDPVSETAVFSIDRIEAAYSLPMLLAGVFRVNHLAVDGLSADIRQFNERHWNLWAFTPRENNADSTDDSGSNDLSVNIRDLVLTNAALTIAPLNDSNGRFRKFRSAECRTDLKIGKTIQADIDHLAFDMAAPRISVIKSSMRVDYDYQNADIKVKNGRVETRQSEIRIDSRIRFVPDGPRYDVAADFGSLAVAELSRLFAADSAEQGKFSGRLQFSGLPVDLSHDLVLRYSESEIKSSGRLNLESFTGNEFYSFGHIGAPTIHAYAFMPTKDISNEVKKAVTMEVREKTEALNVKYGGCGGEWGLTAQRAGFLTKKYGSTYADVLVRLKKAFDPENILNRGNLEGWM